MNLSLRVYKALGLVLTVMAMVVFAPVSDSARVYAEMDQDPIPPDWKNKLTVIDESLLHNPTFDNHIWYEFHQRYDDSYPKGVWLPDGDYYGDSQDWRLWFRDGTDLVDCDPFPSGYHSAPEYAQFRTFNTTGHMTAGLYQVVQNVTPCLLYRFQIYSQSRQKETNDSLGGLKAGIEPTGWALNPNHAPGIHDTDWPATMAWGAVQTTVGSYVPLQVTAEALSSQITVFSYADASGGNSHKIHWDTASLEQVPRTENLIDASQPLPAPSSSIYGITVDKGANSASISWNTGSINTYGQLLYRVLGSGTWQYSSLHDWGTTHQIDLTGLQTSSTYEYVVVSYGYIGGACQAIVSETDQFSFATSLTGVSISGQATGALGKDYTFTANASPSNATTPVEYVWEATGKADVTHSGGGLQDSVSFSWDTPGVKTIRVTASNAAGSVQDTHTIDIRGDEYETDDTCSDASSIPTNGARQRHTFHSTSDPDWVYFDAVSGFTYLVEGLVPADSDADLSLYVYDACGGEIVDSQAYAYTPDVRLPFTATKTGRFYLFLHQDLSTSGTDMAYDLSVRAVPENPFPGAVVLVAGKLEDDDPLQSNIHHAADAAYQFFTDRGYDGEDIYYLSTDTSNPDVDDLPSYDNLQYAVSQWAITTLASKPNSSFTLYMVDHGGSDTFYLNGSAEQVSPSDLDTWLTFLEGATVGIQVNVVLDAPQSGSFIGSDALSAEGRVVIASTGAGRPAWATEDGVLFSDYFVAALRRGLSLHAAFQAAAWGVDAAQPTQTPGLDDDGDGSVNGGEDGTVAAQRGFISVGTMGAEDWPPYIISANLGDIVNGQADITAQVRDDGVVSKVWAEIYPPMYRPEGEGALIATSVPTVTLSHLGGGFYHAEYGSFSTIYLGADRVVIHAVDDEGWMARPRSLGGKSYIYLPLVLRE